jgi:hypothetical protein
VTFPTLKRVAAVFAFTTLALGSAGAHATSLLKFDNVDLAHIAEVVVVGEVQSVTMQRENTAPTIFSPTIRTHNAVKVVETWKGDAKPGDVLDVVESGGIVDGNGFDVIGSCGYKVGERVLLFLEPKRVTPGWHTIAMSEGKYQMLPDGKGGFSLAQHTWKLEERGQPFEAAAVPKAAMKIDFDVVSLSSMVKKVVADDKKLGVQGKDLPQYVGKVQK